MNQKLSGFLVLIASFFILANPPDTSAQNPALTISPVKTTISVNPGEKKQFSVVVKNDAGKTAAPGVYYANFTNRDESGTPELVTEPIPYGGSAWLYSVKSVSIGAGKSATVPITVTVPADAKAGTYYALVRFADSPSATESLQASVASLVFINVGQITQKVEIAEFKADGNSFVARVKNVGTGFTVPSVKIELFDTKGQVVDTIDANPKTGGIITGTVRNYSQPLSSKIDPAKQYTARLIVQTESSEPAVAKEISIGTPEPAADNDNKGSTPLLLIAGLTFLLLLAATVVIMRKHRAKNIVPEEPPAPAAQASPESNPVALPENQTLPSPPATSTMNQPTNPVVPSQKVPQDTDPTDNAL